jgi:trk system potassium uptake protein
MPKLVGSVSRYPARALFAWYLGLISVGTFLLSRPVAAAPGREAIHWVDALFTATSAACVTGLIVVQTPHDFSVFGQVVILVLFQLGGIGIMTIATFAALSLSGRESLRQRATVTETLGAGTAEDLRSLLGHVLLVTFLVEGAGFLILFGRFLLEGLPWGTAAWHALFYAVSAFCNAGFALHDDSLEGFQGDPIVNVTVMLLVIVGGIGFPVLRDIHRTWKRHKTGRWEHLHLHTKLILIGTAGLVTFGGVAILVLEWDNRFADMSAGRGLMVAMFQSVASRTAGFNTVPMGELTTASLFIIMLLMFVGGSPGSTAGGFKVSTFMILVLHAWSKLRGFGQIRAFRRTLPSEVVGRAIATVLLFAFVGTVAMCLILITERIDHADAVPPRTFFDGLFEVVSGLGTVGLSTGVTGSLTAWGKGVIIFLMFAGRIGPVSLLAAFSRITREERLKYPDEVVLIG